MKERGFGKYFTHLKNSPAINDDEIGHAINGKKNVHDFLDSSSHFALILNTSHLSRSMLFKISQIKQ